MFNYLLKISTTVFVIFISSCEKENENVRPVVKIIKPLNGLVFAAPAVIEISAELGDIDFVDKEFLVVTKQSATNDTVFNFKDDAFSKQYSLNKNFTSQANTKYKILVSARGSTGKIFSDSVFVTGY